MCNYCKGTGHWKNQFPILKCKNKNKSFSPAPVSALSCSDLQSVLGDSGRDDFKLFVADAFVSLVDRGKHVPIKLLRDTGARH